jgi:hypothetical protein
MRTLFGIVLAGALALGLGPQAPVAQAQQATARAIEGQAFRSPEDGFAALAAAIGRHDEARLLQVLGTAAKRLIRSGDPVADRAARQRFTESYAAKHEILRPAPGRAVLQIGEDGWPLPIPLVERGGIWRFDARQGAQELVDRRIGGNEIDTIATLRAIAEAEMEYARGPGRHGALRAFARRIFSTPGTRDGLYWPAAGGGEESPLGPLIAAASAGGYDRAADGRPQPYHGYIFRILEAQGPAAPGGAVDYLVDGRMIGGFAVLAWPAEYGASGIMTFMISHHGTVYESNLGPKTASLARAITAFDPTEGWRPVAE